MSLSIDNELDRVISSDQHDPHKVLGAHPLPDDPNKTIVRCFKPHAESVQLIVDGQKHPMHKSRAEGIYEFQVACPIEQLSYSYEATFPNNVVQVFQDPYRFPPLLSEYDRYLFNKGNNYELYNQLGAHSTVVDEIAGTVFRVWAPSARRVSVIGNFNFWDGRVHQMRSLSPSGIWEIFIPGIGQGEAYKFPGLEPE